MVKVCRIGRLCESFSRSYSKIHLSLILLRHDQELKV